MDYKISHTTVYSYSEAVPICHNEVHLTPRDADRQSCLSTRLVVKPWPTNIESTLDYFGNIANFFTVQEAHQKLTVTSVSKVRIDRACGRRRPSSPPWETVRDCAGHRPIAANSRRLSVRVRIAACACCPTSWLPTAPCRSRPAGLGSKRSWI